MANQSFDNVLALLQDAQKNKDLMSAMTTHLEKFVAHQRKGLDELETLISNAKEGIVVKTSNRGGARPGAGKKKEKASPATASGGKGG